MGTRYDVVTMGGGLAGAALARGLAERGVRVLVVERERTFKDRVRGEQLQPWGVAEARALGIYGILQETCGHQQPWVDLFLGPAQLFHRDLPATTPQAAPHFNFYHPRMQETLLAAAERAGADVHRGSTVRELRPGRPPVAVLEHDGRVEEIAARLVVGADGRLSSARRCPGFEVRKDEPFLMIAGVLMDGVRTPPDTGRLHIDPASSQGSYLFPQGGGRVRAYASYPVSAGFRLQGEKDVPRFVEESVRAGAQAEAFDGAQAAGPLASFEGADTWVDHPYADGVVLVGDAAASNDPVWGQGLSLTLRDVRVLRDCLLEAEDWDAACHRYASEHDRHYGVIHDVTRAFTELFHRSGPQADARRGRALPAMARDPMSVPDHLFSGPDLPWSDEMRRVFLAEDAAAT